jgi:hypothetical protein
VSGEPGDIGKPGEAGEIGATGERGELERLTSAGVSLSNPGA